LAQVMTGLANFARVAANSETRTWKLEVQRADSYDGDLQG